jgi:excisionase family DNA binding protein
MSTATLSPAPAPAVSATPVTGLTNDVGAGAMLGLSPSKVRKMMRTGELPSVKIGRARRIPWAALHAYVEKKTAESRAAAKAESAAAV